VKSCGERDVIACLENLEMHRGRSTVLWSVFREPRDDHKALQQARSRPRTGEDPYAVLLMMFEAIVIFDGRSPW